jgi:hypothetical protein
MFHRLMFQIVQALGLVRGSPGPAYHKSQGACP